MSPRLTDWSLALTAAIALVTGLLSLFSGHPDEWFIFALHGIGGFWLLLLLWGKLRRVWPRLSHLRRWDRRTVLGLLATLFALVVLGSGIWWAEGGDLDVAGFGLLNWHIILGFTLAAAIFLHMFARAKRLRKRDLAGRRQLLHYSGLLVGAAALWPLQQFTDHIFHLPGANRRFTGSHDAGSYTGNAFPGSSWVADQPRPIDTESWQLILDGAVKTPRAFPYEELVAAGDELVATLDCTSGFFSTQRWRGVRVGRLLDQVDLSADAGYVRFISVTSYRWSLTLEEARGALLATHVGDEPLSYDHGAPLRLVAPGHRGMEWVKWLARVEVLTAPDPGQLLSIFTSSFTPAGRGD
jgi:DMSO/TMAO reductase YedYZ molybdopterin-dependent catalytic subunit